MKTMDEIKELITQELIDADYGKMLKSGLKAKELDDFIASTDKNIINFESEETLLKKKASKKIRIVRRK